MPWVTLKRWSAALAGCLCLALWGCSTPLRPGIANFQESREIDKLANDNSFPLAAEVGLAAAVSKGDGG